MCAHRYTCTHIVMKGRRKGKEEGEREGGRREGRKGEREKGVDGSKGMIPGVGLCMYFRTCPTPLSHTEEIRNQGLESSFSSSSSRGPGFNSPTRQRINHL